MKTLDSFSKEQQAAMDKAFKVFKNAILAHSSVAAKAWLKKHALSDFESGAGFLSARIHNGKSSEFKKQLESVELLKPHPSKIGHTLFGGNSIVFPLKDKEQNKVNMYAIEIEKGKKQFLNGHGLYPGYPSEKTKKLFITKNIIDAASLIECGLLSEAESVLALFDGELMPQHIEAIKELENLQEIIVIE